MELKQICIAATCISFCPSTSAAIPTVNHIQNCGFEVPDPANPELPSNFVPGRIGKPEDVKLTWETGGRSGGRCIAVETLHSSCIGYWETTIRVKPLTEYILSLHYKCRSTRAPSAPIGDPLYNRGRPGGPNLELGVVPEDPARMAKPSHWTDIGIALPPVGGTYLPLATEWSHYQQKVETLAQQTRLRLKLRVYCYAQKVWFDDVSIVEANALRKVAKVPSVGRQAASWEVRDTTPPVINSLQPPPGMQAEPMATVAARWSDTGSGINLKTAKIVFDGIESVGRALISAEGFSFRPTEPLSRGIHRVEVTVSDKSGNRSNYVTWRFGVGSTAPMKVRLDRGGCFVNGEPYFPIGLYAYVCTPTDGRFRESALAEATTAGFDCLLNTILPLRTGDSVEHLDILSRYGMKTFLNITLDLRACGDLTLAKTALIEKGQAQFRDHPCVLGYWADDPENLDNTEESPTPPSTIRKLENARRILKECSPDLPLVWAVSNLPRLRDCVLTADVLLSYRYPVPQYHPKMIFDWTLNYVYSIVGDKPVWFNSQGFDLGYGNQVACPKPFRPTPEEMRAMAYYSLVEGVKGWTLYGCSLSPESQPEQWKEALRIATQIRYLAPVLAAGRPAKTASLRSDGTTGSIYFTEIEYEGRHTLLAVNMSAGTARATWEFQVPIRVVALFEDRAMVRKMRRVSDVFGPYEVHVYQW